MRYREKCLRSKQERCSECGSEDDIEVHHVDGDTWNDSLDNLLPLCHDCHVSVHNGDERVKHLTEQIKTHPPGGEVTEQEVNDAFDDVDL